VVQFRPRAPLLSPSGVLFNTDAAGTDNPVVCRDPLSLIQAVENGVPKEEVVAFLAPITALSLQVLAAFMDEIGVETIDLYQAGECEHSRWQRGGTLAR
jgi:hypothetical protein